MNKKTKGGLIASAGISLVALWALTIGPCAYEEPKKASADDVVKSPMGRLLFNLSFDPVHSVSRIPETEQTKLKDQIIELDYLIVMKVGRLGAKDLKTLIEMVQEIAKEAKDNMSDPAQRQDLGQAIQKAIDFLRDAETTYDGLMKLKDHIENPTQDYEESPSKKNGTQSTITPQIDA